MPVQWALIVFAALMERRRAGLGTDVHAFMCRDHWIRAVFRKASKLCKIPFGRKARNGWCPHDLRHVALTNLLQCGVDIATVRDFAGHEDLSETTKYVHATDPSRQRAAETASSLVSVTSRPAPSADNPLVPHDTQS